ncbi:hypothetical protein [Delftia acidovorans]|uniref:hypothetical protein n=1 Tax=Delftia acidovorans TaxID=80866 RepID=UPI0022AB802A|nr:hypothetical protein [Delftia acidovorans]WAT84797.1 hypothetical protein O1V13_25715 [Delftia acidovorans]
MASRTWYCGIHWRQASQIAGLPTPRPAIPSRVDRARRRPVRGAGAAVSPRQRRSEASTLSMARMTSRSTVLTETPWRSASSACEAPSMRSARKMSRQRAGSCARAPSTPARAWR